MSNIKNGIGLILIFTFFALFATNFIKGANLVKDGIVLIWIISFIYLLFNVLLKLGDQYRGWKLVFMDLLFFGALGISLFLFEILFYLFYYLAQPDLMKHVLWRSGSIPGFL